MPKISRDKMFILFQAGNSTPLDATTYYVSSMGTFALSTATAVRTYMPIAGRITGICIFITCTAGTAENVEFYLRKNNTTDYTISTTTTLNADNVQITRNDLDIPMAVGDAINLKIITPTWVANPTGLSLGALLVYEV